MVQGGVLQGRKHERGLLAVPDEEQYNTEQRAVVNRHEQRQLL